MKNGLNELVRWCGQEGLASDLVKPKQGLEREALRVNSRGELSLRPHPAGLGHPLTHRWISLDFCEAQLEFITPPFLAAKDTLRFLSRIHSFTLSNMGDELLWPSSAPCRLPEERTIPLAYFGDSKKGQDKLTYRRGLTHRYGRRMQTLSGLHYNFSLSPAFWKRLHDLLGADLPSREFISGCYLGLCRNFLRWGWLNTYLFGASPAVDRSFFGDSVPSELHEATGQTLFAPFATSLRTSGYGYYSKVQAQHSISYNSLEAYSGDLKAALSTVNPAYRSWKPPEQLNDHLLQIEAEYYSRIRPKPPSRSHNLRVVEALPRYGIGYVEVRAADVNPLSPSGVEEDQLRFLHLMMLYCLLSKSLPMSSIERRLIRENQNRVALEGRDPDLCLVNGNREVSLRHWAKALLEDMEGLAALLDEEQEERPFQTTLNKQRAKAENPDATPSGRIMEEMIKNQVGFLDFHLQKAVEFKKTLLAAKVPSAFQEKVREEVRLSFQREREIQSEEDWQLPGYEDMELSTQMVIREAMRRGVKVEVLDRKDNFLRLRKGNHVHWVKQATKTSLDSLAAYCAMENKAVSKVLLKEAGVSVPEGGLFFDEESARAAYYLYRDRRLVVKPNHTNYGLGIHYVEPGDEEAYSQALSGAFRLGSEVIVEQFCTGEEYRFLVINGKCEGVCQRLPANVVGDGVHSIRRLVPLKNADPLAYKIPKYYVRLGKEEKRFLGQQGLSPESVLPRGQRVFLRRNSNVSTGGDPVDVTDEVHEGYGEMAVLAAQAVEATFCGVDVMIQDPKAPPTSEGYAVIEVNFNPALHLHRYPVTGKARPVERAVLDALGF